MPRVHDEKVSRPPVDVFVGWLADELLGRLGPGRRLVAVDGVDGSGKTTFAATLALHLAQRRPTVLVHLDDYLNVAAVRHARGRGSAEGFWLDSYDYALLHERVLTPLGADGEGTYRPPSYDVTSDMRSDGEPVVTDADAVTLVEGLFLHRDELKGVWDASVFLDVPFAETVGRMAARDGGPADPEHPAMHRYVGGQRLYFAAARPWERATFVVDNVDVTHPRCVAADESFGATELARHEGRAIGAE